MAEDKTMPELKLHPGSLSVTCNDYLSSRLLCHLKLARILTFKY